MSNEILKGIADAIPGWDQKIKELEETIAYMDETKQNTVQLKADLAKLRILRNDHYNALKKRGLIK